MKKNLLRCFIFVTVLFSDFIMFAQNDEVPGSETAPEDIGGPLEGGDEETPMAPINTKLILLAIVGVMFAYYTYRRNRRTA